MQKRVSFSCFSCQVGVPLVRQGLRPGSEQHIVSTAPERQEELHRRCFQSLLAVILEAKGVNQRGGAASVEALSRGVDCNREVFAEGAVGGVPPDY